jgi:AraC-like DNA-binding protein
MHDEIGQLPVPSTYTRLLLQRWPGQATALLAGSGLPVDLPVRMPSISVSQQLQVFRNAMTLAGGADWGLQFGRQLNINSHGPLGFAALSAPTLGEGLQVLAAFARIRAPYLGFSMHADGNRLRLQMDTRLYPLGELELPLIEIVMQVANSYVEAVVGQPVLDSHMLIALPAPAHAARYAEHFAGRCEFSAACNAFSLPAALCRLPCPLYDEKTYRAALVRCREALDALLPPGDLLLRAEHWLTAHFEQVASLGDPVSLPRLDDLAAALAVSPRTLIRRLAEHGSSFRSLCERQQRDLACRLLNDARYSVSEIGSLLGYGDAANFGRAFRRLTGISPGQYRRRKG